MKPVFVKKEKEPAKQSKTYARYEKLLSELEKQQQFKSNIEEAIKKAITKINQEFSPLEKEVNLLSRDYTIRLDELATEIGLGKFNREWFEGYMIDELDALLDIFGHQDEVLSALYQKYSGVSVNDIAADDDLQEMVKSLKDMFGFEINVEEFLQKGQRAYFEEYRHQITGDHKTEDDTLDETGEDVDDKKKSKSLKSTEEDGKLAKDARSVYMRLIKKFHPDLEQDAAVRDQHNEIIKQVTQAYQENDFFALLKLQITYLDDNESEAAKIADDMLKRYNKILQKQLNEINKHLYEVRSASGPIIDDLIDKNGKFSAQKFAARKRAVEKDLSKMKLILADSKKRPKGWFKDQIGFIKQAVQQDLVEDMIASMFGDSNF
jgi:hypothetical protein